MDLINDVFDPVYKKVVEKKGDLVGKQKTPTHGFEDWLTIILKSALEDTDLKPVSQRQGPDITFADGTTLELKAAADFSLTWLIRDGALHHKSPVLFLFNGSDKSKIEELKRRPEVEVLTYRYLFDDALGEWILGIVEPVQLYVDEYHRKKKRGAYKIKCKSKRRPRF